MILRPAAAAASAWPKVVLGRAVPISPHSPNAAAAAATVVAAQEKKKLGQGKDGDSRKVVEF